MAEEAVDCYNESEQATGWFTTIEENLKLPFETQILGVPVSVEKVDITDHIACRDLPPREIQAAGPPPKPSDSFATPSRRGMDRGISALVERKLALARQRRCLYCIPGCAVRGNCL